MDNSTLDTDTAERLAALTAKIGSLRARAVDMGIIFGRDGEAVSLDTWAATTTPTDNKTTPQGRWTAKVGRQ